MAITVAGKGDTRRPHRVDEQDFAHSWDVIFGGVKVYDDDDQLIARSYTMNPYWLEAFPVQRWFDACAVPGKGIQDDDLRPLLDELYALFPQPGMPAYQEVPVLVEYGKDIGPHRHPEHTVVYYVDVGDPVCAILVNDKRIEPVPGTAIWMAPDVLHSVEKSVSERPRLSIAVRWTQEQEGET